MYTSPLNADTIQSLREIMGDEFQDLIRIYLRDSRKHMDACQVALDARNFDNLNFAAHALKGSSANIGALVLADMAKSLEIAAKQADLQTSLQSFHQLQPLYLQVESALQKML